jgi:hypothetical protein
MSLVVLALGAVTPAASSAEWTVNKTKLVGTAALAKSAHVRNGMYLRLLKEGVFSLIECTAEDVGIVGGELVAPDELRIKALSFGECSGEYEHCGLTGKTLLTLPLSGLAHLSSGVTSPYIAALSTSKTVAALNFGSCGVIPLLESGPDILILIHFPETVLHLVLISSLPGLELGSTPVSIANVAWLELGLQSGQSWGFL